MTRRFEGKVCLVTGSTGIAEAAAQALAGEGGSVYIVSRTAGHARDLAEAIIAAGGRSAWRAADLTVEAEADAAVADCVAQFGRLDCVYNVAGISARRYGDGALHEMTLEGWQAALTVNATSTFLVCRAAVRQMLGQSPLPNGGRGVLLNMSTAIARHPVPRHFATHGYAASKGAIESFTRAVAATYARDGIRLNVIAPALVATPMSGRAQADAEIMAYAKNKQPLAGGIMQPEDMVGTALFLLSDDAAMVTGQVVGVDAGWPISG